MRNVYELLEMFSIDIKHQGSLDFGELVYRLACDAADWDSPDWLGLGGIVGLMLKERKVSSRLFYARMKQAVRPLLTAEPETLAALGIQPPERQTTTALAWSVARWICSGE